MPTTERGRGEACPPDAPIDYITLEEIDRALDACMSGLEAFAMYHNSELWAALMNGEDNEGCHYVAYMLAAKMIEDIGERIGWAANSMVAAHYGVETLTGTTTGRGEPVIYTPDPFDPVLEAPHMEPELVWNISRAYWHEIVYRGMEIGRREAFWITGIEEFSYDEVLVFAQHIWLAFKKVTGLDFTIPEESKTIKFWLGLSKKYPGREHAPDVHNATLEDKTNRLRHYIDRGGPSYRLMEKTGEGEPPPDDGFQPREYLIIPTFAVPGAMFPGAM